MELSLAEKQMAKQALNLEPEEGEQCAWGWDVAPLPKRTPRVKA